MGNLAFYVVLKGRVRPVSTPHVNKHSLRLRAVTPEPIEPVKEVIIDFKGVSLWRIQFFYVLISVTVQQKLIKNYPITLPFKWHLRDVTVAVT